jgi:deoxyxylulose-5-phosphate synthase
MDREVGMTLLGQMNGSKDIQALSVAQLEQLAGEIRAAIIDQVQKTGGHLAPNLGVVELTLAMSGTSATRTSWSPGGATCSRTCGPARA